MADEDKKPNIQDLPTKSSMEILTELFSSFDAEPPLIIKKEKGESDKKHKKSKHKHKEKKHKKEKKRKRHRSGSNTSSEMDVAELLIKNEIDSVGKRIKLEPDLQIPESVKIKSEPDAATEKAKGKTEPKNDSETTEETSKSTKGKIVIKNLKFSSIFEATVHEIKDKDGKETSSDRDRIKKSKHKKHKHSKHDEKEKKHKTRSKSKERSRKRSRSNSRKRDRHGSPVDDRHADLHKRHRSCEDERHRKRDTYHDDLRYRESKGSDDFYRDRDCRYKENDFYRNYTYEKSRDGSREDNWSKSRRRSYSRDRDYDDKHHRERIRDKSDNEEASRIDKKRLLEIARKNAIQMMKSGSLPGAMSLGPQAQEKVIAAIRAGGKTIEELTDFCKSLSRKEAIGELSSVSEDSDSDSDKAFHHPFQIKERPTTITMNIKDSIPLPTKTTQERTAELRMQFPVSSGQHHRITESEWVPVSSKRTEPTKVPSTVDSSKLLAIEAPPVVKPKAASSNEVQVPQVFPQPSAEQNVDIGQIVSQRLSAMRKLQENPNDVQAITEIYKSQKEVQNWASSKQQPGQFTGSTGAQILSQAELSSGYQAWAKKDQLTSAAPVSGGMGMHLLQKMGWKPGEGLGKQKTGALEPLLLEVKLDKKGLVANEEQKKRPQKPQKVTVKSLEGKHPVSLLGEYASKRKLGVPQYAVCFECGPDHKKNFLFKVVLNGVEYTPNVASPNKKEAKANAARVCLQQLGLLPPTPAV